MDFVITLVNKKGEVGMVSNNCRLAGCEITTCACPQGRWSTQQNTNC